MRKFFIFLMLLNFCAAFTFADDFNDAVESSRGNKLPSKSKTYDVDFDEDECCGTGLGCFALFLDESCEIAFDACIDFLSFIWLENNLFVDFSDYPYQDDSVNYVTYGDHDGRLSSRFSLGTSFFLLTGLGVGNQTSFEGLIFPLIGPCIDSFIFSDPRNFTDEFKGNVRAGAQLSFLQTNAISLAATFQWSLWYGASHELLKNGGFAVGLNVYSIPIKPLVLEFKNNWQFYSENVYVYDHDLTMGFIVGMVEFNVGWKLLIVGNSSPTIVTDRWNGVSLGTKLWF